MRIFFLAFIAILAISNSCLAQDMAQCSNPSGHAFFPNLGMIHKDDAGWDEDKISNGAVSLKRLGEDDYDILFIDATKSITSAKQDGAKVIKHTQSKQDMTFLVGYPLGVIEIYTFYVDNSGGAGYTHISSKSGGGVLIPKASVMQGKCAYVIFD